MKLKRVNKQNRNKIMINNNGIHIFNEDNYLNIIL